MIQIFDEDLIEIIGGKSDEDTSYFKLEYLHTVSGTGTVPTSTVRLQMGTEIVQKSAWGDGPVDAIFKCINKIYPHNVNLQLYNVHAVTEGTDAQATVSVRIEENGKTTVGQAANTDTLVASADAYLNALNKMIIKRKKTAPEQINIDSGAYERKKDGTI